MPPTWRGALHGRQAHRNFGAAVQLQALGLGSRPALKCICQWQHVQALEVAVDVCALYLRLRQRCCLSLQARCHRRSWLEITFLSNMESHLDSSSGTKAV